MKEISDLFEISEIVGEVAELRTELEESIEISNKCSNEMEDIRKRSEEIVDHLEAEVGDSEKLEKVRKELEEQLQAQRELREAAEEKIEKVMEKLEAIEQKISYQLTRDVQGCESASRLPDGVEVLNQIYEKMDKERDVMNEIARLKGRHATHFRDRS